VSIIVPNLAFPETMLTAIRPSAESQLHSRSCIYQPGSAR